MTTVTINGASDDLIEVDGDIREEFYLKDDDKGDLLAFSDGTILRVRYGTEGVWRINGVTAGTAEFGVETAPEDDESNYSDRATLTGEIRWVVHGIGWALAGGAPDAR